MSTSSISSSQAWSSKFFPLLITFLISSMSMSIYSLLSFWKKIFVLSYFYITYLLWIIINNIHWKFEKYIENTVKLSENYCEMYIKYLKINIKLDEIFTKITNDIKYSTKQSGRWFILTTKAHSISKYAGMSRNFSLVLR